MVNLLFLDSTSPLPFPLQANLTDSIEGLKLQIAAKHPSAPKLDDVRLLRGGRFLKDSETVQDVLGLGKRMGGGGEGEEEGPHTIHLVLRGVQGKVGGGGGKESTTSPSSASSSSILPAAATNIPTLSPSSSTSTSTTPLLPPPSAPLLPDDRVLDLTDAVGLYTHLSRSSLCTLLNLPTIQWEDIVPTPQVSEQDAKRLVKQTVEGFGVQSGLGEEEGVEQRGRLEDWVGEEGGEWTIEVDGLPYHLSVPPPSTLTPTQQTALHSYLLYSTRLTLLHQIIQNPLPYILAMLPPSSQTHRPLHHPLTPAAVRRQSALLRVVPMMIMSLVKYSLVWYIFTQGETVWSRSFWGVVLLGWWLYEGMGEFRRAGGGDAIVRPAPAQPLAAAAPTPAAAAAGTTNSTTTTDGTDPATTSIVPTPPPRPLPTFHLPPTSSPFHSLALLGLSNENNLLALSPSPSSFPTTPSPPLPNPAQTQRQTRTRTTLQTLLLPPLLLLLSIAPPLEALRTSTIRRREAVMRELVEVLTIPPTPAPVPATTSNNTLAEADASTPTVHVLPAGLGDEAKAYYRRVLERGERIDWAAEVEAQREGLEREERERERGGGGGGGLF